MKKIEMLQPSPEEYMSIIDFYEAIKNIYKFIQPNKKVQKKFENYLFHSGWSPLFGMLKEHSGWGSRYTYENFRKYAILYHWKNTYLRVLKFHLNTKSDNDIINLSEVRYTKNTLNIFAAQQPCNVIDYLGIHKAIHNSCKQLDIKNSKNVKIYFHKHKTGFKCSFFNHTMYVYVYDNCFDLILEDEVLQRRIFLDRIYDEEGLKRNKYLEPYFKNLKLSRYLTKNPFKIFIRNLTPIITDQSYDFDHLNLFTEF